MLSIFSRDGAQRKFDGEIFTFSIPLRFFNQGALFRGETKAGIFRFPAGFYQRNKNRARNDGNDRAKEAVGISRITA